MAAGRDAITGHSEPVVAVEAQWRALSAGLVRELWFRPQPPVEPVTTVVVLPGLGLPRYLLPVARALAAGGTQCVIFDALAFRRRGRRVPPTIEGLAAAGAEWLRQLDLQGPVCVVGHSTGAQVALEVVLSLQGERPGLRLVMAGPTFLPAQRRWRRLAPAALTAYRKDTPKELVVVRNLLRVRTDVVRIVLSALRHRPEQRVPLLQVPLRLTAGEADSFAPREWLDRLASSAGSRADVRVLPGSHNNVFTHVEEFVDVVTTLGR